MRLAILLAAQLGLGAPNEKPELSDGFYCATDQYFAYETLLDDSADAHLLHLVPLVEASRPATELTIPIPAALTRGIRCTATAVLLRSDSEVTKIAIDTRRWSASRAEPAPHEGNGTWKTTRLWGDGVWSRSATERKRLRTFGDGSSTSLEIYRVSSGGPECTATVGSRLAWRDPGQRETRSRPLFLRSLSCRKTGLDGGPVVDACAAAPGQIARRFQGRVSAGRSYRRSVAAFVFKLVDGGRYGWTIVVTPQNEPRDITSLLPLHGRSGRDIQPFDIHLWTRYPFSFHPEVRRGIDYSDDTLTNLINDIRIDSYGQGRVTITRHATEPGADGRPQFRWIEFDACLSWPR